jgi:hypothetical protein
MIVFNPQRLSDCSQRSVGSIKECVSAVIILRSDPFPFHDTPKRLGYVQMRGIGGNVEKKKTPLFPDGTHLSDLCSTVNADMVEYNKS